ncbi:MAG: iron ABC transporter permease [Planctomycetales bacterium]|nr:iron ABC transporter permease [Planctomycetales bacterium]
MLTPILNTILLSLICALIAIPTGLALAVVLIRTNVYGRTWASWLLGTQLAIPLYVFAGSWCAGVGTQGWLQAVGPMTLLWPFSFTAVQSISGGPLLAVAFIHGLAAIPWVCLLCSLGLFWRNRSEEDLARTEGGLAAVVKWAVLPRLKPWIAMAIVWCVIPVFTEMVITNLYQVPSLAEQVYLDASRGEITATTYFSAFGWSVLPLGLLLGILYWRTPPYQLVTARLEQHRAEEWILTTWRTYLSVFLWFFIALLVGFPLLNLVIKAAWHPILNDNGTTSYEVSGHRLLTTLRETATQFQSEFYWTITIAVSATFLSLVITLWMIKLAHNRRWLKHLYSICALLMLATPGPLVGMLVIAMMNRASPAWMSMLYDQTIAPPVLAQQFRLLPLAWILGNVIKGSVSPSSHSLAALDGLTRWSLVKYVIWPQAGGRIKAACLFLFVTSCGELSCSILVLPPGITTVSMRIFELLHFGTRHHDAGLCLALVLLGWGVTWSVGKTLRDR